MNIDPKVAVEGQELNLSIFSHDTQSLHLERKQPC